MHLGATDYPAVLADLDRLEGYLPRRPSTTFGQAVTVVGAASGEQLAWVYLRQRVITRHPSIDPLVRKTVSVSEEAFEQMRRIGDHVKESQGR